MYDRWVWRYQSETGCRLVEAKLPGENIVYETSNPWAPIPLGALLTKAALLEKRCGEHFRRRHYVDSSINMKLRITSWIPVTHRASKKEQLFSAADSFLFRRSLSAKQIRHFTFSPSDAIWCKECWSYNFRNRCNLPHLGAHRHKFFSLCLASNGGVTFGCANMEWLVKLPHFLWPAKVKHSF